MATFRLEFDNHGEPVLVEECNGTTATPIADWVERYLSGMDDVAEKAAAMAESGTSPRQARVY